ncbi:predicted protein [Histoplasma capsulatum H143]|uniref:Uncharacterized protein n=1 Tax=Ajellomyces capsulatus (strain H143) TaxID=544712 RepID=C6HPJ2_AJECH|nr:predicted protein [Histoplasma capsulatum H143]
MYHLQYMQRYMQWKKRSRPSEHSKRTVDTTAFTFKHIFAWDSVRTGGDGGAVRSISQNANAIGYRQLSPGCKKGTSVSYEIFNPDKNSMHPKCQVAAYKATEDTVRDQIFRAISGVRYTFIARFLGP